MKVNNVITYNVEDSAKRIDEILNASNDNFKDSNTIPNRDTLTFSNGFYVGVTAIFIDIVGSSDMTDAHRRPVLAKIYRSFISECVAIMNSNTMCKEININGDCVWGIFDTRTSTDIDDVLDIAGQLRSLVKILNYKLKKKGYEQIKCGVGIDDGRALMGRNGRNSTIIGGNIYQNLKEKYKAFFTQFYDSNECGYLYEGDIINIGMDHWYKENCK